MYDTCLDDTKRLFFFQLLSGIILFVFVFVFVFLESQKKR